MRHRMSSKPACFKASKCSDGCDIPATGYQYETVSRCSTNHTAKKNLYESLEVMTTCIDTAYNICTLIYIFMYTNIYIYIICKTIFMYIYNKHILYIMQMSSKDSRPSAVLGAAFSPTVVLEAPKGSKLSRKSPAKRKGSCGMIDLGVHESTSPTCQSP